MSSENSVLQINIGGLKGMTKENIDKTVDQIIFSNKSYEKFLPIFEALKKLNAENKSLIIAIEGRCGSGKSSLAALLKEVFVCNVFHMDDYFLPFEMKTAERLEQPGENVHYERFQTEVLGALQKGNDVTYRPYSCSKRDLGEPIHVEFKNLTIVEGSYCLHPTLQQAFAYKIFLTVDPQIQRQRILKRNGEEKLQDFISKWIPLEEHYFSALSIQEQCNLVFDTTFLWN